MVPPFLSGDGGVPALRDGSNATAGICSLGLPLGISYNWRAMIPAKDLMRALLPALLSLIVTVPLAQAAADPTLPAMVEGDFTAKTFRFTSGQTLPEINLHYRTFGRPWTNSLGQVTNAVLILHGTTGNGGNFVRPEFSGVLFNPGQLLDANRYYLILPDALGHGKSSRPSDGLKAGFPNYGYRDMIEAQYRLVTEGLHVNHLRLVMGTSMGGMHTWLWAETHPDFMDAAMPLASLPTQISGRNRVWRRMIIDAIRNDPSWQGGAYTTPPASLRTALEVLYFMGNNPVQRQKEAPTLAAADNALDLYVTNLMRTSDANNILYAVESSRDYDPGPALERIQAPLLAINFGDDLINPPELGILEREIIRVPRGRAVLIPAGPDTRGHGTHTLAAVWKDLLADFLQKTAKSSSGR